MIRATGMDCNACRAATCQATNAELRGLVSPDPLGAGWDALKRHVKPIYIAPRRRGPRSMS